MDTYEILKDCWVNGKLYKKSQLIKLTEIQANEWIDRKCIKPQEKIKKQKAESKN